MIYVNKFDTTAQYQSAINKLPRPQIALIAEEGKCRAVTEPGKYGVFIVDEQGHRYTADQWDSTRTDARFVKLSNEMLNPGNGQPDNSIVISKNWEYYNITHIWQANDGKMQSVYTTEEPLEAETNYNGALNTQHALSDAENMRGSLSLEQYVPALMYVNGTTEIFKGEELHAYVPAMGQYMQIIENLEELNKALQKIGANTFPTTSTTIWHSSTQYSYDEMWVLNNRNSGHRLKSGYFVCYVLPIFSI